MLEGELLDKYSSGITTRVVILSKRGIYKVIVDEEDSKELIANLSISFMSKFTNIIGDKGLNSKRAKVIFQGDSLARYIASKYYKGDIKDTAVLIRDGNALNMSKSNLSVVNHASFRRLEAKKAIGVEKRGYSYIFSIKRKEIGPFGRKSACALSREILILENNLKLKRNFDNMTLDECKEDLKLLYL